jgi:hypothetical protein
VAGFGLKGAVYQLGIGGWGFASFFVARAPHFFRKKGELPAKADGGHREAFGSRIAASVGGENGSLAD